MIYKDQIDKIFDALTNDNDLFGGDFFYLIPGEENQIDGITDQRVNYGYMTPIVPASGQDIIVESGGMANFFQTRAAFKIVIVFKDAVVDSVVRFVLSRIAKIIGMEILSVGTIPDQVYLTETGSELGIDGMKIVRIIFNLNRRIETNANCEIEFCPPGSNC